MFSLACVMYQVLRGQPLITAETTSEYRSMLASMHLIPVDGLPASLQVCHPGCPSPNSVFKLFDACPCHNLRMSLAATEAAQQAEQCAAQCASHVHVLQGLMRSMLARAIHERPVVSVVPEAAYFKGDRLLRALRFMDSILQRDTAQKHAFVRDLPSFWAQFDKRVLRLRVLPCLMHQWQDEAMRDAVLPLVLAMAQDLPTDIFQNTVRIRNMPERCAAGALHVVGLTLSATW